MLIGIVGKPSSGKSTFLNAACKTNVKTGNYPFTTIDPNLGKSFVRTDCVCTEFNVNDNPKNSICKNGIRFIPIKLLDVAGLVPDAHTGKGMGNKFLSDLSRADVLIHVIDISGGLDAEGQNIMDGKRDPIEDIRFLEEEINYWFMDLITHEDWTKFCRKISQENLNFSDMLYDRLAGISVKKEHILKAIDNSKLDMEKISIWSDEEIFTFAKNLREISKPIVIAANKIDKKISNGIFVKIKKRYKKKIIPCSALAEFWLKKLDEDKIINYTSGDCNFHRRKVDELNSKQKIALKNIQDDILNVHGSTGIQKILNYCIFNVLNQIVVYPVQDIHNFSDKDGNIFPDAHLVENGMQLKNFIKKKIHTDLAKNFIYGINGRTKMRLGESYELKNNDVIKVVSATK